MNRTARSFAGAALIAILTHMALPGPAAVQAPDRGGTADLAFSGDLVSEGRYTALRCASPAGGGGLSFQAQAEDWLVSINTESAAGVVPLDAPGAAGIRIQVRGRDAGYERGSPGGWVQVLPGLDGVKLDVPLRRTDGSGRARLVATFSCG